MHRRETVVAELELPSCDSLLLRYFLAQCFVPDPRFSVPTQSPAIPRLRLETCDHLDVASCPRCDIRRSPIHWRRASFVSPVFVQDSSPTQSTICLTITPPDPSRIGALSVASSFLLMFVAISRVTRRVIIVCIRSIQPLVLSYAHMRRLRQVPRGFQSTSCLAMSRSGQPASPSYPLPVRVDRHLKQLPVHLLVCSHSA
jgi:hypothetical protein